MPQDFGNKSFLDIYTKILIMEDSSNRKNFDDINIYSVSQAVNVIKDHVDSSVILSDLTVIGETANHSNPNSGHHYFSLRDQDSALECVMFRSGRGGEYLLDGSQVMVHGRISMYPARGKLQLYADLVQPQGVGALQQAFEALKAKLATEGLFDLARKRPLPEFPRRIAVITSPTGAVIQDITNVLQRRYPMVEVLLIPVPVQGESSAPAIVNAFAALTENMDIDVTILARGGGSMEDLWPFNEESVARAVFSSTFPVISAIGHETDITIVDYVADVRAPTPSAAAELVVPNIIELQNNLNQSTRELENIIIRAIRDKSNNLELLYDRMDLQSPKFENQQNDIKNLIHRSETAIIRLLEWRKERVDNMEILINGLGPKQIMNRGYSIVRQSNGNIVKRFDSVSMGDSLEISLYSGSIEAEVKRSENSN